MARESKEKLQREKTSPFSGLSQRVIVCFEMGVPYSEVRQVTRPRTQGPWGSSRLVLGRKIPTAQWPSGPQPCATSDFEIGDAHFKADYYYSLRKP